MGSDYEILTEKDMPYFRELVDKGQAVIIEIPEDVIMSLDIGEFEEDKEASKITDEELLDYINSHRESFIRAAERNEQIMENSRALEEELMGTEELPLTEGAGDGETSIMPAVPLPASIPPEAEGNHAAGEKRESQTHMRDEEWKKAGGPTSKEMLDIYDREKEEQERLLRQPGIPHVEKEPPRPTHAGGRAETSTQSGRGAVRSMNEEDVHTGASEATIKDGRKTPPTPAQLREAKEKARQLGYTGQIPMEILVMLLDVSDKNGMPPVQEETPAPSAKRVAAPASEIQENPPQHPVKPSGVEQEAEPDAEPTTETEEPEIDNTEDTAFIQGIEDSIKKNRETTTLFAEGAQTQPEKDGKIPEDMHEIPYTGDEAELYREVAESGQFSVKDIHFVMSSQIPVDYKRQLFRKMLENKLDEDEG